MTPTAIGTGGSGSSTDQGHSTSVAVADLNRDGIVDLVIGNDGTSNMIYLGVSPAPGTGDFSGVTGLPFGSSNGPTTDVAVGDVDGDGAPDIAAANDGSPNVMYWGYPGLPTGAQPSYARLPANEPAGGTSGTNPWPWSTIGDRSDGSTSIALGDLDDDGDLDIVVGNADGSFSKVHLNTVDPVQHALSVALDSSYTAPPAFVVHVTLPPSIHATHGTVATLAASSAMKIGDFKQILANLTGVGVEVQHLHFGNVDLTTGQDHRTLGDNNVLPGSTLELTDGHASSYVVIEIPTLLQDRFGFSMAVSVTPSTTAADLKQHVADVLGVDAGALSLSHTTTGSDLTAATATLSSLNVESGDTVAATLTGSMPASNFTVTIALPPSVQPVHGAEITLAASNTTTIEALKATIQAVIGISTSVQELTFENTTLATPFGAALGDYGIVSGSTVHLTDGIASAYVIVAVPQQLRPIFGSTITIAAEPTASVGEVLQVASAVLGVDLRPQLTYVPSGQTGGVDDTLEDLDVAFPSGDEKRDNLATAVRTPTGLRWHRFEWLRRPDDDRCRNLGKHRSSRHSQGSERRRLP